MNFEQSPSLKDFQNGLREDLPPKKRLTTHQLIILVLLLTVVALAVLVWVRSDNNQLVRGTGSVKGYVVNDGGLPFQGEIYILGTDLAGVTDSNGFFQIDGVPAGKQCLIVADQRIGHEFQIAVLPGEVLDVGALRFVSTATP
ncbi:MAG: hypothetical protein AB1457_09510 [Chloroflexota bacterium]|nr:MAG: hypothetical protein KatS3mg046_743 [Bellilinea sp.]GIV65554.1 MAG: hypothetical protein KatS3mg046_814 [Bellilinea sp.]